MHEIKHAKNQIGNTPTHMCMLNLVIKNFNTRIIGSFSLYQLSISNFFFLIQSNDFQWGRCLLPNNNAAPP